MTPKEFDELRDWMRDNVAVRLRARFGAGVEVTVVGDGGRTSGMFDGKAIDSEVKDALSGAWKDWDAQ